MKTNRESNQNKELKSRPEQLNTAERSQINMVLRRQNFVRL